MAMQEAQRSNHLVLVSYPLQGHISPILELASVLQAKGFSIIIAHTKLNSPNPSKHPDFFFLPMSENLCDLPSTDIGLLTLPSVINANCEAPFQESLSQFMEQNPHSRVRCIIYDIMMYCAEAVASNLKIPSITVCTISATSYLAYSATSQLHQEGQFPAIDTMLLELVPGLHSIRFKDLPTTKYSTYIKQLLQAVEIVMETRSSSAVIWNTVDCLEHHSLAQFQQQNQVPSFSLGPLHMMAPATSTSLLEENTDCLLWLAKQIANSVLYISLGSLAIMDQSELTEMAWGLASSGQPFLWVIRPGSVHGSEWIEHLPRSYIETIGDRGRIVKWAPQKEILAHGAVGGFWSHCGWNSTLESICEGVPMICRPVFGDQKVNARYLSHIWKTGLELENVLDRQSIEKAIRRLMQDEEGKEMRQNAAAMKEKVKLSRSKDGTSYNSLNKLVKLILSF